MDNIEKNVPVQPEDRSGYTIDELLAQTEPEDRENKNTIRRCIAGLIEHAAWLASMHQEYEIYAPRRIIVAMAEFWGLAEDDTPKGFREMAEQYNRTFDCAVSAAWDSGCAPKPGEQAQADILSGLRLYAQELRESDDQLEEWATECDVVAEIAEEQWRLEAAAPQQADQTMGGMSL